MTQPTALDLDAIEARANAATPGPWTVSEDYSDIVDPDGNQLASYWNPTSETRNGEFIAHAPEDIRALLAEVRRLAARVTELEGPAVYARAALGALCYDLVDPGINALGALYELSHATSGIDAPKDDAALALGRHAHEVLEEAADMADPEPPEVSFFGDHGPVVAAWLRKLADRAETTPARP